MIEVGPATELELGTGRRGGTSSSSSSTTHELLLGVAGGLPQTLAELVEQLLAEDEEAAAVSLAVLASTRLRSRARRPATSARSWPAAGATWRAAAGVGAGAAVGPVQFAVQPGPIWGSGSETSPVSAWRTSHRPFQRCPSCPPLVPVVESNELLRWGVAAEWPAWALSLADAHSKRTGSPWSTWSAAGSGAQNPVQRLRAAGARRLALTGVMNDQRLAALWPALTKRRLVAGFDLVLTPAWSTYDLDPRLEHLFAIRQSALAADLMAGSGPVVPTLNWYRKHDLDRQLAWLERTGAAAVGVDCSTLPGAQRWREIRSALAYIRTVLPAVELHVYGASSAERVQSFVSPLPPVSTEHLRGGMRVAEAQLFCHVAQIRPPAARRRQPDHSAAVARAQAQIQAPDLHLLRRGPRHGAGEAGHGIEKAGIMPPSA